MESNADYTDPILDPTLEADLMPEVDSTDQLINTSK